MVTARPRAAKFSAGFSLVIALAGALVRRDWGLPLSGAGAPAARLLAALAAALVAGAIPLIRPPPRPAAGRLPTGCAAISRQRMPWLERAFTAFQQAKALPAARRGLLGGGTGIFWSWAQGRYCSRRSSLGAKRQLRTEAIFLLCGVLPRARKPASLTLSSAPRASHRWRRDRLRSRRDPPATVLARLGRKTGTLIGRY